MCESQLPDQMDSSPAGCRCKLCLAVLIFSKDRPCQLLASVASLLEHITEVDLDITVLFKASSEEFRESYQVVRSLLGKKSLRKSNAVAHQAETVFHWDEEDDVFKVGDLLDAALARMEGKCRVLLFTVDDALWFGDFHAGAAIELLCSNSKVYAVHAKLCPRVEYAHPNDKFMRVPPLSHATPPSLSGASSQLLLFERSNGEYDWNYPWELSASLYRLEAVKETLQAIRTEFGKDAVHHPNHIEGYGVRLLKQQKLASASLAPLCACLCSPVVVVVTINRVQSLFENPVYEAPGQDAAEVHPLILDKLLRAILRESGRRSLALKPTEDVAVFMSQLLDASPEFLCSYWGDLSVPNTFGDLLSSPSWPPALLQPDVYRNTYLDSVHVPLLVAERIPRDLEVHPLVSWLIPVRDTPSRWLNDAFDSIQAQLSVGPGAWELVVVDDGSQKEDTLETLKDWRSLPNVQVVRAEASVGVGPALNLGWKHCRGRYVARLDGDDVAQPSRLIHQISFLEKHSSISILGGGFRTFTEDEHGVRIGERQYRFPCHPLLARWHMIFSCSLAHPTVVMRRDCIPTGDSGGPYPEDEEAEDHCCWLAMPLTVQIANIADVVCHIRRHSHSRTASAAKKLLQSSYFAVRAFLKRECAEDQLTDADVAVLWGREGAATSTQAAAVSHALGLLQNWFTQILHADTSPELLPSGFREDFLKNRLSALEEYAAWTLREPFWGFGLSRVRLLFVEHLQ